MPLLFIRRILPFPSSQSLITTSIDKNRRMPIATTTLLVTTLSERGIGGPARPNLMLHGKSIDKRLLISIKKKRKRSILKTPLPPLTIFHGIKQRRNPKTANKEPQTNRKILTDFTAIPLIHR